MLILWNITSIGSCFDFVVIDGIVIYFPSKKKLWWFKTYDLIILESFKKKCSYFCHMIFIVLFKNLLSLWSQWSMISKFWFGFSSSYISWKLKFVVDIWPILWFVEIWLCQKKAKNPLWDGEGLVGINQSQLTHGIGIFFVVLQSFMFYRF